MYNLGALLSAFERSYLVHQLNSTPSLVSTVASFYSTYSVCEKYDSEFVLCWSLAASALAAGASEYKPSSVQGSSIL